MSRYVKFSYERAGAEIAPFDRLAELNECRRKLRELDLIGVDANGIGFGNLSVCEGETGIFYVTGSATGGLPELALSDCVRVVAYDFKKNWVRYEGSAVPSSESLTHAAIYKADASVSAIIHGHDPGLWERLLDRAPTTSKGVTYGTPEMASEIMRLFAASDVRKRRILAMAGHESGIFAFGRNFEDALEVILRERKTISSLH